MLKTAQECYDYVDPADLFSPSPEVLRIPCNEAKANFIPSPSDLKVKLIEQAAHARGGESLSLLINNRSGQRRGEELSRLDH